MDSLREGESQALPSKGTGFSRKGLGRGPWFPEPAKKELDALNIPQQATLMGSLASSRFFEA